MKDILLAGILVELNEKMAAEWVTKFRIILTICCLIISFVLVITRCYQVYSSTSNADFFVVKFTHLSAMIFYAFYQFFITWNDLHWYAASPTLDCDVVFFLFLFLFWGGRCFMYAFLMLRSYFFFKNSVLSFHPLVIRLFIIFQVTGIGTTIIVSTALNSTIAIHGGFCIPISYYPWLTYIIFSIDIFSSLLCLAMFCYRVYKLTSKAQRYDTNELNMTFAKHLLLGSISVSTVIPLLLITLILVNFSGFFFSFDATLNILLLFLIFKENERYYNVLCKCLHRKSRAQSDQIMLEKTLSANNNPKQNEEIEMNPVDGV